MPAAQKTNEASNRDLTVAWLGIVDYQLALDLQNTLVSARLRDIIGDILLLLEHPHVYTLGRGADERFVLDPTDIPVYRVSRGGQVTYHGPGQLIGYPIVKLDDAQRDVIRYLRRLEQVLIEALGTLEIVAQRRPQLTGVWIGQEKIASIGVGFRRWVSLHGFALNVTTDLSFFDAIVPCGISGCRMTSIAAQRRGALSSESVGEVVAQQFAAIFNYKSMLKASRVELSAMVDPSICSCEARDISNGNGTKAS
jgi:lipoyl(octanoyl) transferase